METMNRRGKKQFPPEYLVLSRFMDEMKGIQGIIDVIQRFFRKF